MTSLPTQKGDKIVPHDSNVPADHVEFGKELAALCRKHNLRNFSARYSPGFDDQWRDDITFSWNDGRHGEDKREFTMTSTLTVRVTVAREEKP